ncbi:outer membrane beta-barrel protein [Rhizorhapis sp. SPR117]|uniref:outer membrane beta-barrel protein n=1 Tax=Rhizorhapis sp. SPR117 TaxID=2912611 RepID=UPI001F43D6ED|nr:outer membrane beta-barrel protein [Rhizorhapis sp. SPR117]
MVRQAWPLLAVIGGLIGYAAPALAQQDMDGRYPSVLDLPRKGYEPRTIQVGSLIIRPEMEVSGEYDNNIYALQSNKVDDFILTATPRLDFNLDHETLVLGAETFASFRRYADNTTENSTTFGGKAHVALKPTAMSNLAGGIGFVRAIEDRGDPEARLATDIGPRRFNDLSGDLSYRITGGHMGVEASGEVHKLDYLSVLDDERDHTSYRGALRGFYRVSPLMSVFMQGYFNRRAFSLSTDNTGIKRNANTFGGSAGVQIDPGGKLRGEVNAGIFRFDPDDASLKPYTGLQFGADLTYSLTPRSAITFAAFRGDVATVRNGATSRTDTRFTLGLDQEIRHNLLYKARISWRETNFRGTSEKQRTLGGNMELEYIFGRHVSLAALGRYAHRNSNIPGEDYERFRGGLALRLKY